MTYLSAAKKFIDCFMLEMLIYKVLQDKFGPHSVNNNGEHSVDQWHKPKILSCPGTRFVFYA